MTEVPWPIRSELNPGNEKALRRPIDPEHFEVRLVDEHDRPGARRRAGRADRPPHAALGRQLGLQGHARGDRARRGATGGSTRATLRDDADGTYFIDRVKDAIRRRGENISSFEVESEVAAHPSIEEVAAVGVPNPDSQASTGDEEVKV